MLQVGFECWMLNVDRCSEVKFLIASVNVFLQPIFVFIVGHDL